MASNSVLSIFFQYKLCSLYELTLHHFQKEVKVHYLENIMYEINVQVSKITRFEVQSTPDNSNLQGKSKKVRVIGSSKKIAGSKEKTVFTAQ